MYWCEVSFLYTVYQQTVFFCKIQYFIINNFTYISLLLYKWKLLLKSYKVYLLPFIRYIFFPQNNICLDFCLNLLPFISTVNWECFFFCFTEFQHFILLFKECTTWVFKIDNYNSELQWHHSIKTYYLSFLDHQQVPGTSETHITWPFCHPL